MGTKQLASDDIPVLVTRNDCSTPGSVYSAKIKADWLSISVSLPISVFHNMDKHAEQALAMRLHDAVLPVIEEVYRSEWSRFAGKGLIGHSKKMPDTWEELDPVRHRLHGKET